MKTEVVDVKKNQKDAIEKAVREIKKGNIVVIPTETSYGLAGLAKDKQIAKKIAQIKKQPQGKPVSIIVPDIQTARKHGQISESAKGLMEKFMPGPLTLIVPAKKNSFHLGGKTIAFRVSSNKIVSKICERLGKAITATSANIHGKQDNYSAKMAFLDFNGAVSLVVDAGVLPKRKPSTIYDVENKMVLRHGKVSEKQIRKALQGFK